MSLLPNPHDHAYAKLQEVDCPSPTSQAIEEANKILRKLNVELWCEYSGCFFSQPPVVFIDCDEGESTPLVVCDRDANV